MRNNKLKKNNVKYVIGIDEVGRGPFAGPVTVAAFAVRASSKSKVNTEMKKIFVGAKDSKKMSAKQREDVFKKIKEAHKQGIVRYIVQNQTAKVIDAKGLSFTIKLCVKKCLEQLKKELNFEPDEVLVLLDGGLKAPQEFIHQQTIIKGDDKELTISLASICAKVTRDAYMHRMAKKYPVYGFERHVGYGTKYHREMIQKHGLTPLHRRSFLKKTL